MGNSYAFQCRRYDYDSFLYYYRARYYKPTMGRFLSIDSEEFDNLYNQYTFVQNNPAKMKIQPR